MKVPERNPRPILKAPPRGDEVAVPPIYHKIKRESRVFGFVTIVIGFCVSFCLMLFAAVGISDSEFVEIGIVIAIFGIALLAVCLRWAWSLAQGPKIRVITFEPDQIVWGCVGKEKQIDATEIGSVDWFVDSDSQLTLSLRTRAGKRISFYYIDYLVSRKSRPKLLAFLTANYPDAPLSISESN